MKDIIPVHWSMEPLVHRAVSLWGHMPTVPPFRPTSLVTVQHVEQGVYKANLTNFQISTFFKFHKIFT